VVDSLLPRRHLTASSSIASCARLRASSGVSPNVTQLGKLEALDPDSHAIVNQPQMVQHAEMLEGLEAGVLN
jgi:hypothetical protein